MMTIEQIAAELGALKSCIVSAHVAPDPDAIGSSFGLASLLAARGCRSSVYLADGVPERLHPLLPAGIPWSAELPGTRSAEGDSVSGEVDAIVVVDTASRQRVGREFEALYRLGKRVFNIDHHVSNDSWGELNFIDGSASAAAILVWRIARALGQRIEPVTANLLYAGVIDDTGSFCFSNVNSETFACGASLLESGAEPEKVANTLYFSVPQRVLKLQVAAFGALKLHLGGKVASLRVTREMLDACGARPEDTEGLVDIARRMEGTLGAFLQRELQEEGWKISLRAKSPELDVNAVAARFGGGGHRAAAGCRIDGPADDVERRIVDALRSAFEPAA